MNTEQEIEAFEAAMDGLLFDRDDDGTYKSSVTRAALEAYQAGRAALQSQDREDAMRWRYWRWWWMNSEDETEQLPTTVTAVWRENPDYELEEAFDHARRVEGDGEWMS